MCGTSRLICLITWVVRGRTGTSRGGPKTDTPGTEDITEEWGTVEKFGNGRKFRVENVEKEVVREDLWCGGVGGTVEEGETRSLFYTSNDFGKDRLVQLGNVGRMKGFPKE